MTVSSRGLAVPYTDDDLAVDVLRAIRAWKKYHRSRKRNAIYGFLGCIFEIVTIWKVDKRAIARAPRMLEHSLGLPARTDPYYALLAVAARPIKIDDRTAQKWARVLSYAGSAKLPSQSLRRFVRKKGGINMCAAQGTLRKKKEADDDWDRN